jgi:hypothetical protein
VAAEIRYAERGPEAPRGGSARLRLETVWRRLPPGAWALVAITLAVLAANAIYLLDFSDPNPLAARSGLLSTVVAGLAGAQPTIDPNNGFVSQAIGHLAALDLLGLHLPWWNPFEGTGAPLLGETQSAALFAPTLLTAISNGQLYEHILFELVAGGATYLLLRRLSIHRLAATAGGIAFALNGTFAWFMHATVNPVALLPLLLLGIEMAAGAAREGRRGGWWLIAVAGALSVYAGFPEVAYIDALMGVVWFGWRLAGLDRSARGRLLAKAGAGVLGAVLLAAPMLVAILDTFTHSDLGAHGGTLFSGAHLGPDAIPQLLLPYVYGPIFTFTGSRGQLIAEWGTVGGFLSVSLLLFALMGLGDRTRRGLKLMLLAWGVLVFARMFGEPPLLGHVLGLLPGMSRVAFFRYADAALELSAVILAAAGLDDALRRPDRRRLLAGGAVALALVVLAAVGARSMVDVLGASFARRPYYWLSVAVGVLVVVAGTVAALRAPARWRAPILCGLLALESLGLFVAPELAAPRAVTIDLAPVAYLQRHLGTGRFFTLGPLQPDYGSYFKLAELNVNDIPVPDRFAHYVNTRLDPGVDPTVFVGNYGGERSWFVPSPEQELARHLTGYREAGVRYVLTSAGQPIAPAIPGLTAVFRSPTTLIYRLSGAQPYFTAPGCQVRAAGREAVTLICAGPATLVRRETYFPGWSASIDGRSVRVRPDHGDFQQLTVPAGRHVVRFGFVPPGMAWAGLGLLVGLLWLAAAGLRARRPPGLTTR